MSGTQTHIKGGEKSHRAQVTSGATRLLETYLATLADVHSLFSLWSELTTLFRNLDWARDRIERDVSWVIVGKRERQITWIIFYLASVTMVILCSVGTEVRSRHTFRSRSGVGRCIRWERREATMRIIVPGDKRSQVTSRVFERSGYKRREGTIKVILPGVECISRHATKASYIWNVNSDSYKYIYQMMRIVHCCLLSIHSSIV